MSERYVLDIAAGLYVDRDAIPKGLPYEYSHDALARNYENRFVFVGTKKFNVFRTVCRVSAPH